MSKTPAAWRTTLESYPCATCGADPGEPCTTSSGREADVPHSVRGRAGQRCSRCGGRLESAFDEPLALCAKCSLLRRLEVERATKYQRRT